ncbi:MAG: putative tRNA-dihydrouridine synthase [Firmicutes bacterium]|nr:putative tRNA-dihydrouridine synthase [candidate division NPL-UPA2 bacterium]
MRINNILIVPPLVAAPMAGITDQANRLIAREFGAAWVVSEMISCKGIIYDQAKTWELLAMAANEPLAVQLFGSVPAEVAEAAAMVAEKTRPLAIDINMGCPTPKIVKGGDGAALLLNPKLAGEIVRRTVAMVNIPVTVKTRKAWDANSPDCLGLVREVEAAGAAAITIHGRTRDQFYSGKADWGIIRAVKATVSVPVIGNGDVTSAAEAKRMLEDTGCDAVMVGRAAIGNPWLYRDIARSLQGLAPLLPPSLAERLAVARRHLAMVIERKGEYRGIREMRLQLAWYLKGLPRAARIRDAINKADSLEAIEQVWATIE